MHRQDLNHPLSVTASQASLSVQRGVFELRCARIIVVETSKDHYGLVLAAENASEPLITALKALTDAPLHLALTQARAKALHLSDTDKSDVLRLDLQDQLNIDQIVQWTDPLSEQTNLAPQQANMAPTPENGFEHAAIALVKLAHLLPTALIAGLPDLKTADLVSWLKRHNLLCVQAQDIFKFNCRAAKSLLRVSEADVPLADVEQAKVVAFRPADGGLEHLAIIIGDLERSKKTPLVRIHSQCFTGDLLGSLRCDCGDQLRGAIQAIAQDGAGVLLYLAQEGRGIGLVNKLKAYVLQDQGKDTLEANEHLGFDADERIYVPAAIMLRDLGLTHVRLLTNNPQKVNALVEAKIHVIDRVAHAFPTNKHNETYLHTKKVKGGHLL